ncbi:hypothetical protein [Fibrella forsythiae]|uniref:Uncharacterized protein n=1 Tax=Fibrella forsythiae TaxID=2817061 RepID=A0ABS3JSZ7_9BACT|nr:hypothetical protein [Fibrella forsythiae]MBO0953134.1 hypothetical protein [Fibrella forsythiae]
MIHLPGRPYDQPGDQHEQQWREQATYETKARLALEEKQKLEEEDCYLYQINPGERALMIARHETERKALARQHRAMRLALRKDQGPASQASKSTGLH